MSNQSKLLLALGLLLLGAAPAFAQGGVNGSIVGNVFDQTGAPVKGVKVSAKSDTQIGGAKSAYSNDEGYFRIIGLAPGNFEVTATAPKLKTVLQKDIQVGVNASAEINVIMEVETTVEEVKVVEKAPIISTTTANVKETFEAEFLDSLPVENRIGVPNMIAQNTANAYVRPGGGIRFSGGGVQQRAETVEGFRVNGQPVTFGSLAAIDVQTAGYGADNADVPGGVINMVSKSGSNKFEFDLTSWAEDSNLQFFKDTADSEAHSFNYYINPAVSGPIIKDRVWFYLNADYRRESTGREANLSGFDILPPLPATQFYAARGSLKLTWQVTPRNKLSSFTSVRRNDDQNRGTIGRDERDSLVRNQHSDYFSGLIWEALLGDNVFFRSQVGYQQQWTDDGPQRCRFDPDCDNIRQVRNTFPQQLFLGNAQVHTQTIFKSIEVINQIEWFIDSKKAGEHHLKVKSRVFDQMFEEAQSTPGDGWQQFIGTEPDRERIFFSNDPRFEEARYGWRIRGTSGLNTVHSLTDSVRLTRHLTVSPGLAFTSARAANVGAAADLDGSALTYHFSTAWDATHDGRTAVRASYNQYVDPDALRLARFALGDRVFRECRWNVDTAAYDSLCTWGGGSANATIGLPCGPDGISLDGTSCKQRLRVPKTYEYTVGVAREIVQGVALDVDLIYRLFTFPYETYETNRLWEPSGYDLDGNGGFRNGRAGTVSDLETPASARRRYLAVTTGLHKREGALKLSGSYTWARLEGNVNNNEANDFGTNPSRDAYYQYGFLADDFRHNIRTSMTWQIRRWFSLGLIYRYRSGLPYQRNFRNDVEGAFTDKRAVIGVNPAGNLNDGDDDRPLRLPDIQEMNVQFRFNLKPLTGQNIDAFVDVLNILALRTTTTVIENDGPTWSQPNTRMGPLRMRIGGRYRF